MLRVTEGGDPPRRREAFIASYKQLARSLIDLEDAADRIFDTVSARVAEEGEKLATISERIRKAKVSINALTQSKGPLIIKSPSHYPSSCDGKHEFHALFEDTSQTTVLVNGGLNREFGLDGILELYQFFSEANFEDPDDSQTELGKKHTLQIQNESGENPTGKMKSLTESFFTLHASHSTKPKHQELPPIPPSLINYKTTNKFEDFSLGQLGD